MADERPAGRASWESRAAAVGAGTSTDSQTEQREAGSGASAVGQHSMGLVHFGALAGQGVLISRIQDRRGTWISLKEACTKILPDTPQQSFKNHLHKSEAAQRPASEPEKQFLCLHGAIRTRAGNAALVEIGGVCAAVRRLTLDQSLVQSVARISSLPLSDTPAAASGLHGLGISPPAMLGSGMPLQLPPNPVPAQLMCNHFSLTQAQRDSQPLQKEVSDYVHWLKEPVQLDRPGGPVVPRTASNMLNHIYQYLGFMKQHKGKQPSLYNFLDLQNYAGYLSFQRAKGNTYCHVSQQLATARKVLAYLKRNHVESDQVFRKAVAARDWLSRVNKQLSSVMPQAKLKTDISDLPVAHEVVHLLEGLKCRALNSLPPLGQAWSHKTARLLHDACLACCMFGYLPPVRLVCLRTLQLPDTPKCLVPGCLKLGCRGNRLVWDEGHLTLLLNHYKVERKWMSHQISIKLPAELSSLLEIHLRLGHRRLCQEDGANSMEYKYVFMDRHHRHMQESQSMTQFWEGLLHSLGCRVIFPPHRLRDIFIDERRSKDKVQGPQDHQAAMAMGNSERAWTEFYDTQYQKRECQAGIQAMAAWRTGMLAKPVEPQPSSARSRVSDSSQGVAMHDAPLAAGPAQVASTSVLRESDPDFCIIID